MRSFSSIGFTNLASTTVGWNANLASISFAIAVAVSTKFPNAHIATESPNCMVSALPISISVG